MIDANAGMNSRRWLDQQKDKATDTYRRVANCSGLFCLDAPHWFIGGAAAGRSNEELSPLCFIVASSGSLRARPRLGDTKPVNSSVFAVRPALDQSRLLESVNDTRHCHVIDGETRAQLGTGLAIAGDRIPINIGGVTECSPRKKTPHPG
jgi:hypothetical protein